MPIQRKNTNDLERAIAKIKRASEINQGVCLMRNEAAALYEELQRKTKQDDEPERNTE